MAKRETLKQFANNLPKFGPLVTKRILKNWQVFTEESFAGSQEKVPILTGALQRSGAIKTAKITAKGIESTITYNLPYAQVIESGERNGRPITLKPKGFQYPNAVKQREGQFKFLESAVEDDTPNVIKDIKKSISQAFQII